MFRLFSLSILLILAACEHQGMNATIHDTQRLDAYGNEPFWRAHIEGSNLLYTTPENIEGTEVAVQREDKMGSVSFTGEIEEKPFHLSITNLDCTDSMSGKAFPYNAVLEMDGQFLSGCAEAAKEKAQRAGETAPKD